MSLLYYYLRKLCWFDTIWMGARFPIHADINDSKGGKISGRENGRIFLPKNLLARCRLSFGCGCAALRLLWLQRICLFLLPLTVVAASDPYAGLARQLAGFAPKSSEPVKIAVGNFLYEDTALMSSFSSLLRHELERALAATGKFKIITRDRLKEFNEELMFQGASLFDPGPQSGAGVSPTQSSHGSAGILPANPPPKVAITAIRGIVRGRFYLKSRNLTIYTELAWLEDGAVNKAKTVIPAKTVGALIEPVVKALPVAPPPAPVPAAATPSVPASTTAQTGMSALPVSTIIQPHNLAQSHANLADVERRVASVPRQFPVQVWVREARRDFVEGETISYRVWSERDCHVAVFCHQVDGSTVVLFPNRFNRDTALRGGQSVNIPGETKSGFQIVVRVPFGADVVQVIACTQASALHRKLRDYDYAAETAAGTAYRGMTRGMFVQGLSDSLAEFANAPTLWSEAHVVVCTSPRPLSER